MPAAYDTTAGKFVRHRVKVASGSACFSPQTGSVPLFVPSGTAVALARAIAIEARPDTVERNERNDEWGRTMEYT
jgi:hypothetical protein